MRSVTGSEFCAYNEAIGVDLNRNYDFGFAYDDVGSNPGKCEEDYRGPYAFSEPGSRQIRNFLTKNPEGQSVKIALNLHSWGNLLIHPFNYINHNFMASKYTKETKYNLLDLMCKSAVLNEEGEPLLYQKASDGTCVQKDDTVLVDVDKAFRFYKDII